MRDLTREPWKALLPLLEQVRPTSGRELHDVRQTVAGGVFRLRTGIPGRDLPPRVGPWWRAWTLQRRWARLGVWAAPHRAARDARRPDRAEVVLDGTIIRAHPTAAAAAPGRASAGPAGVWAPRSAPSPTTPTACGRWGFCRVRQAIGSALGPRCWRCRRLLDWSWRTAAFLPDGCVDGSKTWGGGLRFLPSRPIRRSPTTGQPTGAAAPSSGDGRAGTRGGASPPASTSRPPAAPPASSSPVSSTGSKIDRP